MLIKNILPIFYTVTLLRLCPQIYYGRLRLEKLLKDSDYNLEKCFKNKITLVNIYCNIYIINEIIVFIMYDINKIKINDKVYILKVKNIPC